MFEFRRILFLALKKKRVIILGFKHCIVLDDYSSVITGNTEQKTNC